MITKVIGLETIKGLLKLNLERIKSRSKYVISGVKGKVFSDLHARFKRLGNHTQTIKQRSKEK